MVVDQGVTPSLRLQRFARLLSVACLGGLAFLMGHAAPERGAADRGLATGQAMSEAWTLAEAAQGFVDARRPREALSRYQRAYELSSDPSLLLEVARLEREVGHLARATDAFERFLERIGGELSDGRKQLLTRQLQAAASGTARVNLQSNVLGAEIEIDPERGVAKTSGFVAALLLDAGERRISVSKPGYETQTLTLTLEPGEVKSLRVDLDKAAAERSEGSSVKLRWTSLPEIPAAASRG